jgi:hypothetical protein
VDELERALPFALPPRAVVRLLLALVPRDAPPLRELDERDSLERLRVLARPLLDDRPRAELDFFAAASRPPDFVAADREPPLDELERRDPAPDFEALDRVLPDPPDEPLEEELREPDLRSEERVEEDPLRCDADALPPRDPDALPLREPEPLPPLEWDLPRELPRPELFSSACCAVSRLTILLKLLRSPPAVVSWYSKARPRSSNFANQSSQLISSSDPSPLYPGKSRRMMPGSSSLSVRTTALGLAPRSSAQRRISS